MNSVEPSGVLYSRLSCLDPESASKVMGFILIHGPNEADMMSLATAPDAVLHHLISKGKNYSRVLTSSLHSPTATSSSSPRQIPVPTTTAAMASSCAAAVVNGNGPPFASSSFPSSASASSSLFHHADGNGIGEVAASEDDNDNLHGSPTSSFHNRSLSLSDAYAATDDLNHACGTWKFDGFEHELLRARSTQQQRLAFASQIMSGGTSSPSSFPFNKYLSDSPRSKAVAAMMMGEDASKLAHFRSDRNDLSNAMMGATAGSRQIYLTFPADSTFREEDVSNYFSIYGPVQDVRIPYQQKRMFGFVTFVHPETVKIILAKGNPHFVCDSRVLVKPYKEKGNVEKKHLMTQHQLERGDLSSCLSPRGVAIRDFDVPIGPRMFYNNTRDLLMRRKMEEQAEFQQGLEMQIRKMGSLQLLDLKNLSRHQSFSPTRTLSPADAISSPTHHPLLSPNHMRSMGSFNHEAYEENNVAPTLSLPPHVFVNQRNLLQGYSNINNCNEYVTSNANKIHKCADSADNESIDLVLPDTLDDTISSKPAAPSRQSLFSSAMLAMNEKPTATNSQFSSNNSSTIISSACISNMALPESLFLDDPSFGAAGNRAIEM